MRCQRTIPKIAQRICIEHRRRGEPGQADRKAEGENPKQHQRAHRHPFKRANRGKPSCAAKHGKPDKGEYLVWRRGGFIRQCRRKSYHGKLRQRDDGR